MFREPGGMLFWGCMVAPCFRTGGIGDCVIRSPKNTVRNEGRKTGIRRNARRTPLRHERRPPPSSPSRAELVALAARIHAPVDRFLALPSDCFLIAFGTYPIFVSPKIAWLISFARVAF